MRLFAFCLSLCLTASPIAAQNTALGLAAPAPIVASGLLKHVLPRFSLKTGVRVMADDNGPMVLAEAAPGTPVFRRDGVTYYLRVSNAPRQQRFHDWLISDIGRRTVESFRPDGVMLYDTNVRAEVVEPERVFDGDAAKGARLARTDCGRCHVVDRENRMRGLGSTPSFMLLRALPDWGERFEQFYIRRPHGSFTQLVGVTAPFDPEHPPVVVPLSLTLDDLDAILAYVSGLKPADLGAPLQTQ